MDDSPSPADDPSWSHREAGFPSQLRETSAHGEHLQYQPEPTSPDDSRRNSMVHFMSDGGRRSKSLDLVKAQDGINEHSPLLRPTSGEDVERLPPLETVFSPSESDDGNNNNWVADAQDESRQETKSSWYLFLLTLSIAGLQIAWSVELSNGSPYLLSLGISKSLLAIVWIAGPLSGTLVQPYVGLKSDHCRSRFGRRRPFMVGGAVATILSLLALAWTKEIVGSILHLFGAVKGSRGVEVTSIAFAILMIYVLDFSINVIQAGIRAFIVDNAPSHQQDAANAWASRISGMGNIVGYLFGYVDLPRYFWYVGDTQFKVLCVFASVAMSSTLAISCVCIHERDPRLEGYKQGDGIDDGGLMSTFRSLYLSVRKLPPQIRKVCTVQFAAWIGWFPFLFYITTYVAEIYVEPIYAANPDMTKEEVDIVWQRATRVGTFALFMFAITTFSSSVLLPFVVARLSAGEGLVRTPLTPMSATLSAREPGSGYFGHNTTRSTSTSRSRNPFTRLCARLPSPEIPWLTLRRAWMISHIIFATITFLTFFVHTTTSATILVATIGLPWSLTNWAPFALIASEIRRRENDPEAAKTDGADIQAGVVLGIHNVAIAAPQVIATLVSSAIFRALQKPRGSVADDSVAWVLRFGGCCALIAAWLTRRVEEERRRS